jgi:hypothetical protein
MLVGLVNRSPENINIDAIKFSEFRINDMSFSLLNLMFLMNTEVSKGDTSLGSQ